MIIYYIVVEQIAKFRAVDWGKYRGKIIGEDTITGQASQQESLNDPIGQSVWFFGEYGYAVKDGVLYDTPIPYKGQLGFFEVKLSDVVLINENKNKRGVQQ